MDERRYVDFRRIRAEASILAERAIEFAHGARDASTALDEVRAAEVAHEGTAQGVLNAIVNARDQGVSWTEIGRALGLAPQGALQRFAEADADALARAVLLTRTAGPMVRVPKPMAVALPAFDWVREGLERGEYAEGSREDEPGRAYVEVSRVEFLARHPRCVPDRFLIQHLTDISTDAGNLAAYADTLEDAMKLADQVWGPERTEDRQEISDSESDRRWSRAGGHPQWSDASVDQPAIR